MQAANDWAASQTEWGGVGVGGVWMAAGINECLRYFRMTETVLRH